MVKLFLLACGIFGLNAARRTCPPARPQCFLSCFRRSQVGSLCLLPSRLFGNNEHPHLRHTDMKRPNFYPQFTAAVVPLASGLPQPMMHMSKTHIRRIRTVTTRVTANRLPQSMLTSQAHDAHAHTHTKTRAGTWSAELQEALSLGPSHVTMPAVPDAACYQLAMECCVSGGRHDEALSLLAEMESRGLSPNEAALRTLIRGFVQEGLVDGSAVGSAGLGRGALTAAERRWKGVENALGVFEELAERFDPPSR